MTQYKCYNHEFGSDGFIFFKKNELLRAYKRVAIFIILNYSKKMHCNNADFLISRAVF